MSNMPGGGGGGRQRHGPSVEFFLCISQIKKDTPREMSCLGLLLLGFSFV